MLNRSHLADAMISAGRLGEIRAPRAAAGRRALLASTALSGVFIAVIAGHPHSALAQSCSTTGLNPVGLTCSNPGGTITTTNTTNVTSPNAATNDRIQSFPAVGLNGNVTATTTVTRAILASMTLR